MPKILVVLTGSDHWTLTDGTKHPTGFWAEELLAPLEVFSAAGFDVDLASPGGVTPVVDEGSLSADTLGEEESAKQRKALDALSDRLALDADPRRGRPRPATTRCSSPGATAPWRTSPSPTTWARCW